MVRVVVLLAGEPQPSSSLFSSRHVAFRLMSKLQLHGCFRKELQAEIGGKVSELHSLQSNKDSNNLN